MHIDQQPYRALHEGLHTTDGPAVELLGAWLREHADQIVWLKRFEEAFGPAESPPIEDRWRLYALSRVFQVLALRFQSGSADGSGWPGPDLSVEQWCAFAEGLGFSVAYPEAFSPFDCEVTDAEHGADDRQPISLVSTRWPCLMLGSMLFCRAGVSVVGGRGIFDASVAASSTLYWAYRRKTRLHQDLSHGWGGNSQWRTDFRRDYRLGDQHLYNVDGKHDLGAKELSGPNGPDSDGYALNREERIELLTHRCFVAVQKPSDDLWPYDDKLTAAR